MTNKKIKIIIIGITFVGLVVAIAATLFVEYIHDRGIQYPKGMLSEFNDTGEYEINPKTILLDIEQGKTDLFMPIIETPTTYDTPFVPIWSQSDYLKVMDTLHQFVWKESLDDWLIYGMRFRRNCQDDPVGFDFANITYYKQSIQQEGYTVRVMEVYPLSGRVSWGGGDGFSRPLFGWKNVNMNKLKVTADDALQIAEENGGKDFRFKIKNACQIILVLKPNPEGNLWFVYYHSANGTNGFSVSINPYTGWHVSH